MAKGYHHLTQEQRCQIYTLKATKDYSQAKIARQLCLLPCTLSRELKRNTGGCGYRHKQAHTLATARRHEASSRVLKMTPKFTLEIEMKLGEKWSPEQIAGRFKSEGKAISPERIYQHVRADKKRGGKLYQHLRHRAKLYNKRLNKAAGRGCIPNRMDIKARPASVEQKASVGHWEGDLVMGPQQQAGALATYVERYSKFAKLAKVANKTAAVVTAATEQALLPIARYVQSITYDNGKEFAGHLDISKTLQAQCFFATPYHSWERGLNEHTNGLIRQYFKKGSDLSQLTTEEIQRVEDALNDRPRKVLHYRTPREVFLQARLLC